MSVARVTCPLLCAADLVAAQPYGVSLTTGGIAPASLWYDRLTPVAPVAGPRCLAGEPLLGCVPARLSSVAFMAPGDVCHGLRCSLAGLRPAALVYRSCHWPGGPAGSPQFVSPLGCRPWCPVPLLFSVHVCVLCCGPRGACSPVCALCAVRVCCWWLCPSSPPLIFLSVVFFLLCICFVLSCLFFLKKWKRGCAHTAGTGMGNWCSGSVVSSGVYRRCFGGGRAPGARLARSDVHGYGSAWVWLVASLLLVLAG